MTLIFTEDKLILSKSTHSWSVWQDLFDDFTTSITFNNVEELAIYLMTEYKLESNPQKIIEDTLNHSNADFHEIRITMHQLTLFNTSI
jgi:hypothetical protein